MIYLKVREGIPTGHPFSLPTDYVTDDGRLICNVECLTPSELISEGLYSVTIMNSPEFDPSYQILVPDYILVDDVVQATYTALDNPDSFKLLVQSRLDNFARGAGFDDMRDASLFTSSTNTTWKKQAILLVKSNDATWQAFEKYSGSSWVELQSLLPNLAWS